MILAAKINVTEQKIYWGIGLAQVITRCSIAKHGRGLPEVAGGIRGALPNGCGVHRIHDQTSLAGWFQMPAVRGIRGLADQPWPVALQALRCTDIGHSRHDLARFQEAASPVVPRDVA